MNYYEKHIGDYIRDTVSLTMTEDGAYGRLMDQVYQSEKPLPLDKKMIYRLARAASTSDRKAVDFVLATFFQETDEGYVQKRIAKEIERYQEKQRKAKASAEARWNKPKQDANASQTHDASDMRTHSEGNAHQTPDTKHQTPDLKTYADDDSTDGGTAEVGPPGEAPLPTRELPPLANDPAVQLTVALRRQGVNVMSTNPHLLQWVADGVTIEQLTEAVRVARETKGDTAKIPPGYLVPIVEKIRNPPAAAVPTKRTDDWEWKRSKEGIERKGRDLGLFARGGESHDSFRDRIQAAIDKRKGQP